MLRPVLFCPCSVLIPFVDHVIFANVVPSTTDTIYGARHTALGVGAKMETPAYSVNRLCGSGIQAIADARNMIRCSFFCPNHSAARTNAVV